MNVTKVTVDALIVEEGKIVLIKRRNDPYKDCWALPGGFVEYNERTEEAVVREVKEETGLTCEIVQLTGVYSAPGRDPRGHTVSIVYLMRVKTGELAAGDDAKGAAWIALDKIPHEIAFDHAQIIRDALKLLSNY